MIKTGKNWWFWVADGGPSFGNLLFICTLAFEMPACFLIVKFAFWLQTWLLTQNFRKSSTKISTFYRTNFSHSAESLALKSNIARQVHPQTCTDDFEWPTVGLILETCFFNCTLAFEMWACFSNASLAFWLQTWPLTQNFRKSSTKISTFCRTNFLHSAESLTLKSNIARQVCPPTCTDDCGSLTSVILSGRQWA